MKRSGIAIVGMAGWFAESENVGEFWENLKSGRECVGVNAKVEAAEGDGPHTVEQVNLYERAASFDASLFGLSPREAERLEPQQRQFLELAWEALEDGGYAIDVAGANVGVFGGSNFTSYFELPSGAQLPDGLDEMIGADKDYLATRVAHHLGLTGPAITVQSACSTSLVAVHLACQSLTAGECDAALAGGVSITRPRMTRYTYTPGGILSPDGYCRAFDADAMGTVFTEGAGMVLLMRLEDALARRHPIYAVVRGSAVNNDGGGKASYMAPSIAGQESVIRAAMRAAGVTPSEIGFVEAHGSATVLGDAIELTALTRVFRGHVEDVGVCRLGSVKTNVGHTASAAGVAGLMKTALALKHGLIPANVNFRRPNPDLDLAVSPFCVNAEAQDWPRRRGAPRFAGVSSFGVGGTNAHAILEEPPQRPAARARRPAYVLTLSARNEEALSESAATLRNRLRGAARRELADVAYTLNVGRRPLEHRAAIVCGDVREAREALAGRAQSTAFGGRIASGDRVAAFMFPGQGVQHLGMGRQLYREEAVFRSVIDACLSVLARDHDLDLTALFREDEPSQWTEADIARTRVAQPLIFMVEYALASLLMSWGVRPNYVIGHSIGEYAAACVARVFRLEDALRLVALRGELMQALPAGAMLSIAAPIEAIAVPPGLDVAATNSPRQLVLSGATEAIDAFAAQLEAEQTPCTRLRTSHAFHSRMMDPILDRFRAAVATTEMRPPAIPLVSNITGGVLLWETLRDPDYFARHIREPVSFAQGLDTLVRRGVDLLIEVGPGRLLSGLAQQNGLHRQQVRIVNTMHNGAAESEESAVLMRAVSRIWLEGGKVDWPAVHAGEKRRMVSLPAYPFARQTYRTEPVAGRAAVHKGKLDPARWLYSPTWRRLAVTNRAPDLPGDACWLVLEGEAGGAPGPLARRLRAQGERVVAAQIGSAFARPSADAFVVSVGSSADFASMCEALKAEGLTPRKMVHAWGIGGSDLADATGDRVTFERRQLRGIYSLARCLKGYKEVFGREPAVFEVITSGVAEVIGGETLRPGEASAVAFARLLAQENVHLAARVLDVDPNLLARRGEHVFDRVVEMLRSQMDDRMIALRGDFWWAQGFEPCSPADDVPPRLKKGGVYLITGGMGYIGQIFARHLASAWNARLVLAGRSPLEASDDGDATQPSRSERLAEIQALGGEALYVQADVSNLDDVRRLRAATYERFGELDGVIFGAGAVEERGVIEEIDDSQLLDDNYAGKAHGLKNFLEVFKEDPLEFGLVLSSISTVLGGLGLCAYSAANHVADALVLAHRQAGHRNWMTTNWDLWGDGHFSEADRRFSFLLTLAIQPEEGCRALEYILGLPNTPQVIVSTHDLAARIAFWVTGTTAGASPQIQHKRPNLETEYAEVEGELEHKLHEVWSLVLGIETIGRDDDFFEMGGHSILAVRAAVQIQEFLPPDSPAPNIYDTPTIRQLAESLGQPRQSAAA